MKVIVFFAALLALPGLAIAEPVAAYRSTCINIVIEGTSITADCGYVQSDETLLASPAVIGRVKFARRTTTLANSDQCVEVANVLGTLTCKQTANGR